MGKEIEAARTFMAAYVGLFISNRHGKFYSSQVARNHKDEFVFAIAGPYDTEWMAEKWGRKWMRLNLKRAKRGESVILPDLRSVPPDVRAYITAGITAALKQWDAKELDGKVFGPAPQSFQ
jgi:hypothetical protein